MGWFRKLKRYFRKAKRTRELIIILKRDWPMIQETLQDQPGAVPWLSALDELLELY